MLTSPVKGQRRHSKPLVARSLAIAVPRADYPTRVMGTDWSIFQKSREEGASSSVVHTGDRLHLNLMIARQLREHLFAHHSADEYATVDEFALLHAAV